jgi:DUF2911 family protein
VRPGAPVLALALLPAALGGQETKGAFIVRLGRDTIAVERFTRTADRLESDFIARNQVPVVRYHYIATLRPDGSVTRFELHNTRLFAGGATSAGASAVATFTGDSMSGGLTIAQDTRPLAAAATGGLLPYLTEESFALWEQYGRRARALRGGRGSDSVRIMAVGVGGDGPFGLTVRFIGGDSMTIRFDNDAATRFRVDTVGRVWGVDGRATADKVTAERAADLDIEAFATAFAGHPLGVLSPPDSVRASVGDVKVAVDYSRPAMRGRKIFGDAVVPWNRVWRTGANEATRFSTSADLVIDGRTIPAGTYTLWTVPSPTGWKLIFNKQTKAPCASAAECANPRRAPLWGTDYSADSDFVRVDLRTERLTQPVERFTIRVQPGGPGAGGVLSLEWENTRATVAFAKK